MTAGRLNRADPALQQIAPQSKQFLRCLFSDLRKDLVNQIGAKETGRPGNEAIARKRAIYDALLSSLADGGELPDDEVVREYVAGLAKATDEANQYEQAVLEHRAFAELCRALGVRGEAEASAVAMDWDALITRLLHSMQVLIIEALRWIDQPLSATDLEKIFDKTRGLSVVSYHVKRLKDLGVLERVSTRRVRGAWERHYFFVASDE
jgi:hypothetical protein